MTTIYNQSLRDSVENSQSDTFNTKVGKDMLKIADLEIEINSITNYTRELYELYKAHPNDEALQIQVNDNLTKLKELHATHDEYLEKYHKIFENYKHKAITYLYLFDPFKEKIIEKLSDEFIISTLEMKYQNKMFDKEYDLQWWKLIHFLPASTYDCSCLEVLEQYIKQTKEPEFDLIKYKLGYIPHEDSFFVDVYIKNNLKFTIPEDLYPRSITQEQFDKWFGNNKNTNSNIREKMRLLIR